MSVLLVDLAVLFLWLDLKAFTNLNDSMILLPKNKTSTNVEKDIKYNKNIN